ncbi:MAG: DegT/DnrJ/EryC1/StrS family aminotransferase [Casimicrobiaceae bacterium]
MTQGPPSSPGSSIATAKRLELPRLPVLGWSAFSGPSRSTIPSILDRDDICFTTSGRAAIALALRALRIGRGDRVLVPTYHCPTMVAPIVAVGAEPVFFPIDATGAPIVDGLGDDRMQGVRAMIAAHYFGLPQPMATIRRFCDEWGIALIEDCAHALFGQSDGRPVSRWGDFAIASLTKFLPVVDGGCLVPFGGLADLPALRRQSMPIQLKSLANAVELGARHRRLPGVQALLNGAFSAAAAVRGRLEDSPLRPTAPAERAIASKWLADFAPGSNFDCQASSWTRWIAQHAHRERMVAARRRNYARLAQLVAHIPGTRALRPTLPENAAPYVFPLWVDRPERVYQSVRAAGIPVFRWDELWPGVPQIPGDHGLEWATSVFQLGCHQDLQSDDLVAMANALAGIMARGSSEPMRPVGHAVPTA